jgi:hypothetical protein
MYLSGYATTPSFFLSSPCRLRAVTETKEEMKMKANQTPNAQPRTEPITLLNDALAFFNETKGDVQKLMSFKTLMFVTLTNFAANTLQSNRPGVLGTRQQLEAR